MDTFLGRYKNILVLMLVLLAQFVGLAVQVRRPVPSGSDSRSVRLLRYWIIGLISPPEKVLANTGSGVRGFWGNYVDLRHTREQNAELRDEVNRLRMEQAGLLEDARQGQRLQALLDFQQHYLSKTVPAQVIGTAGTDQSRVLYIDKGSKDGLLQDQAVITPDGIVGKVKDVFPHTAQVLEINDQSSGAGVLLEKTRLRGVLRGNAYGQPQMIDILPDERIKPGEPVLTSGGDQIFPRGLPVGVVEKVVTDPEREPYVDVVVKPAANLSHLEEVLVITQTSKELPPATQKDLARSEAASAAETEQQRASQILAERLPGLADPNAPAAAETASAEAKPTGGEEIGRPIQPPMPLHPDRFSPNAAPPAADLTPGKAPPIIVSAQRTAELQAEGAVATPKPKVKAPARASGIDQGSGDPFSSDQFGQTAIKPAPKPLPRSPIPKPSTSGATTPRTEPSATAPRAISPHATGGTATTTRTNPGPTTPGSAAPRAAAPEAGVPRTAAPRTTGPPRTTVRPEAGAAPGTVPRQNAPYVEPKPVVRKPVTPPQEPPQ